MKNLQSEYFLNLFYVLIRHQEWFNLHIHKHMGWTYTRVQVGMRLNTLLANLGLIVIPNFRGFGQCLEKRLRVAEPRLGFKPPKLQSPGPLIPLTLGV